MICSKCDKVIPEGDPYLCLIRNIEKTNYDPVKEIEVITIYQSDEFFLLCADCGEHLNMDKVMDAIDDIPLEYDPVIKIKMSESDSETELWMNESIEISDNAEFSLN